MRWMGRCRGVGGNLFGNTKCQYCKQHSLVCVVVTTEYTQVCSSFSFVLNSEAEKHGDHLFMCVMIFMTKYDTLKLLHP